MTTDRLQQIVARITADSWDVYGIRPRSDDDEWFALADKLTADGRKLADAYSAAAQRLLDIGKLCDIGEQWQGTQIIRVADVRKILEGR